VRFIGKAMRFGLACVWLLPARGQIPDEPFWQDVAVRIRHAPELTNAVFKKLCVDKENVVHVLTDKGVARMYDDTLALDLSFRPLADKVPVDITVSPEGELYYLYPDRWLSNGRNGRRVGAATANSRKICVMPDGLIVLSRLGGLTFQLPEARLNVGIHDVGIGVPQVAAIGANDLILCDRIGVEHHTWTGGSMLAAGWRTPVNGVTCLFYRAGRLEIGTTNGCLSLNAAGGQVLTALETTLPAVGITAMEPAEGGVWFGTARGAFFRLDQTWCRYATPSAPGIDPPHFRYYAGKRWLRDDHVVDLATDRDGHLWVLTKTGLNKIEFRQTTLAEKAEWFHRKIRSRNIRYGFTAERRLRVPGDITSSEMIDTDNDGGWTSYYLGALATRFAVTHEEEIRRMAWESFGALERLQGIHTNAGFPARTFERKGFKVSDPDRWRDAPDPNWEWKGHTSSDEISSQTFAHAVMWELVATNAAERFRVATNYVRIVDHILAHDLYLVDVDGKPTLWGRWNPEYVNWFPHSIGDRRLNSAEITAFLQLAFKMTGDERYRAKAYELFEKHGYLTNILSSMTLIAPTPGYIHQGEDMGSEWNHSDDELAFYTYWVLVRFAFTDELRAKFLAAVADHWEFEKVERYPIWNFIYGACGAKEFDAAGAVWTLRGTPLDTIAWRVTNSHRQDITKLPPNFMRRELKELLPPGERLMARINTQPFILDQGDDTIDFPGDEFLQGYWFGRFVGAIAPAK
jgi:hypothetical protein